MAGRLLLLFIAFPILEVWLLIEVGSVIGALWTVLIIILTAIVGSQLVRRQGLGVMQRAREYQARGEVPALPMLEGVALLIAGFCLIMPGFISAAFGFLLLIPRLRTWAARRILARTVTIQPGADGFNEPGDDRDQRAESSVIEGDYERRDDD